MWMVYAQVSTKRLQTIHSLKSFKSIEFVLPVGGALCKTVDLMTSPGAIQLSHENAKTVIEDYNCIHDMCRANSIVTYSPPKDTIKLPDRPKIKDEDSDSSCSNPFTDDSSSTVVNTYESPLLSESC